MVVHMAGQAAYRLISNKTLVLDIKVARKWLMMVHCVPAIGRLHARRL